MDKRQRERELRRVIGYMRSNRLLKGDYEHGLHITNKGRRRLEESKFKQLSIKPQITWDGKWRLVIYDIPEIRKQYRKALTAKLTRLGFFQLQRSAWLHPFPCRSIVETVSARYKVDRYITYLQAQGISNQKKLIIKFQKRYPNTSFK